VKTHKITSVVGNERGDIEIGKYIVLPRGQDNHLPPRPILLDYTMTHDRFGHSNLHTSRKITNCLRSTGAPQPDDDLNNAARIKNNHYRQKYTELTEPVVFMSIAASTFGRINEEFLHLLSLHAHRDASVLSGEFPEESAQFRFIRAACLANLKGSIGLMLAKPSVMRVTIPLDLSTRSFIPLPRFIRTRTTTPLLTPSIVLLNQSSA
jgi:hypothetical protein